MHPLSKRQTKSVLNSAHSGPEHTCAACDKPSATAPRERYQQLGSSRWKWMNCLRWLGGQVCCQTSSAASQCEPRCCQTVTLQGGATSTEVVVWLWNWCCLCFQCYLPGGIHNTGLRRCSWASGDLKLLMACQEPAACIPLQLIRPSTAYCISLLWRFAEWKSWNRWMWSDIHMSVWNSGQRSENM